MTKAVQHRIPSRPLRRAQRGIGLVGFIVGLVVGLAVALGVAVYVTKVPSPFNDKSSVRTAEQQAAEEEALKKWDPNAGLQPGKTKPAPTEEPAPTEAPAPQDEPDRSTPPATDTDTQADGDTSRDATTTSPDSSTPPAVLGDRDRELEQARKEAEAKLAADKAREQARAKAKAEADAKAKADAEAKAKADARAKADAAAKAKSDAAAKANQSSDPIGALVESRTKPAPAPKPTPTPAPTASNEPFVYFVQAGAFRNASEADAQKARLSLLGMNPRVTERDQAGRPIYRVRLGPYNSKADADSARSRLENAGVTAALVRVQR